MLDNFSISISYSCDGEKKTHTTTSFETDDFVINKTVSNDNRLVLDLVPSINKTITVDKFMVTFQYDFLPTFKQFQKIFCNGYQTWTDSKEYFLDETTPVLKVKPPTSYTGDYAFTELPKRRGQFHSTSYTYIRNNGDIELLASLNESTGFTTFYLDVIEKTISVTKDLEGLSIDNRYEILNIGYYADEYNNAFDKWFSDMHIEKPRAKGIKGYTTWYNYYNKITEDIIYNDLENLASSGSKIDVFQIDDGYQTAVGDWTSIKPCFSGMDNVANAIHAKGMKAGIWLAPFAVSCKSDLFKEHQDWLVKDSAGKLQKAGINWGGPFYTLDIYNNEVRSHLRNVFSTILNDWGYDMVKLDFLYQACIVPYNNKTRGEIMNDAMSMLRDFVGNKWILGCGVPLFPAFGKVEFCRIGPDMDLKWKANKLRYREQISTPTAIDNAVFRRHLNGRAFMNDPDVFLLRDKNIQMSAKERKIVASVIKIFGDVLFTSDNVGEYSESWQHEMLSKMYSDDKIKIVSAEYITNNILHIKYFINNDAFLLTIDTKKGVMLKQSVNANELKISDINAKLAERGNIDYSNNLSKEFDNYDDFEFTRELTEEEKAEIAKEKEEAEIERQKKIDNAIAERKAQKEAEKRAKLEAKLAKKQAKEEAKLEANVDNTETTDADEPAENENQESKEDIKARKKAEKEAAKQAKLDAKLAKKQAKADELQDNDEIAELGAQEDVVEEKKEEVKSETTPEVKVEEPETEVPKIKAEEPKTDAPEVKAEEPKVKAEEPKAKLQVKPAPMTAPKMAVPTMEAPAMKKPESEKPSVIESPKMEVPKNENDTTVTIEAPKMMKPKK